MYCGNACMNNIKQVVLQNLCIECGICQTICPKKCILIQKKAYHYLPTVSKQCVHCGLCAQVCPVGDLFNDDHSQSIHNLFLGEYQSILCAQTRDQKILKNATSGGVATQIISELLNKNIYDCAFLLDDYAYETQLQTKYFDKSNDLFQTQKSRYLPVSHAASCEYIATYPSKKVILIGTGCALSGIQNFIRLKHLNKNNYLFLGLFCDKMMHYGVVEYFRQHPQGQNKKIKHLFFRIKSQTGWPGNLKIEYSDGSSLDLPSSERMKIKDFFIMERCLYCFNKLNKKADISLGDNYVPRHADSKGKSSVILRTQLGKDIFDLIKEKFDIQEDTADDLISSQKLEQKRLLIEFAKLKGLRKGHVSRESKNLYHQHLKKIKISQSANLYQAINTFIAHENKSLLKSILRTVFSIQNSRDKTHKNITIFGIKIKIKRFKPSDKIIKSA